MPRITVECLTCSKRHETDSSWEAQDLVKRCYACFDDVCADCGTLGQDEDIHKKCVDGEEVQTEGDCSPNEAK